MARSAWDGGKPVSARGRFYVFCASNQTTPLTEVPTTGAPAIGDEIDHLWIYPATTTPGSLGLFDGVPGGGGVAAWAWPAGITLNDTRPIFVPLNWRSAINGWFVVAGANISATGTGAFSS